MGNEGFVYHIEDTLKEKVYGPVNLVILKGEPPVHPDEGYPDYHYILMTHFRGSIFAILKSAIYLSILMYLLNWKSKTLLFLFTANLILVHFGLTFIDQTGLNTFSREGINMVNMINGLKELTDLTNREKILYTYNVFFTICLYILGRHVIEFIVYLIGWLNVIIVPSGNTWSILTKPCRYIMLLALYVAAGGVIGANLFMGYNSIQTLNG
jgi:hypothetical protein